MARNDIYTMIATATRMNREDVKKVISAYHYSIGAGREITLEGGNGGSIIRIEERGPGMIYLEVGETCVYTVKQMISVRALAVILTQAHDIGFEKMINDYCLSPGGKGVANVPIDQDLPRGTRNKNGTWPSQEDIQAELLKPLVTPLLDAKTLKPVDCPRCGLHHFPGTTCGEHSNGAPMYAPDGTMLDEKGNRSIFDDIDE